MSPCEQEAPFAFPGSDVAFNCIPSTDTSPSGTPILRHYYDPLRVPSCLRARRTGVSRFDSIMVVAFQFLAFHFPKNFAASRPGNRSLRGADRRRKYCRFVPRNRGSSLIFVEKFSAVGKRDERRDNEREKERQGSPAESYRVQTFNYRALIRLAHCGVCETRE